MQRVRGLRGWRALRAAFIPGSAADELRDTAAPGSLHDGTPEDRRTPAGGERPGARRIVGDGPAWSVFQRTLDLFGDGSLLALPLPGHAAGQIGLLVRTGPERSLLAADGCWLSESYRRRCMPSPLGGPDPGRLAGNAPHPWHAACGLAEEPL